LQQAALIGIHVFQEKMRRERKFVATTSKLFGEWRFATGTRSRAEETDQKQNLFTGKTRRENTKCFLDTSKDPFSSRP